MRAVLPLALTLLMAVSACDKPKRRPAAAKAAAAVVAAAAGAPVSATPASAGLTRRPEMAIFSLDMINQAADPLNTPATITAGTPTTFSGFGVDPVAKAAPKGIDIVVDGIAYGTNCCHERGDVSAFYKADAAVMSGFRVTLPAEIVKRGAHKVVVRVVSADGTGFFDSAVMSFTAE